MIVFFKRLPALLCAAALLLNTAFALGETSRDEGLQKAIENMSEMAEKAAAQEAAQAASENADSKTESSFSGEVLTSDWDDEDDEDDLGEDAGLDLPGEEPEEEPEEEPKEESEEEAEEEPRAKSPFSLPIDFSPGKKPLASGFLDAFTYEDPSISVKIEQGVKNGCDYWVATIKIADPSQLRTMSANGFDKTGTIKPEQLVKRTQSVLAINGDYFWMTGYGFILRQGVLYLDNLWNNPALREDVLLVDEDGDFHGIHEPGAYEVKKTIKGKKVINAFYFGPILVENGSAVRNLNPTRDMDADGKKQRMAIAQCGPLEYKCICCGPPSKGMGMTLTEFAQLVAEQKVKIAYNLDGGYSTMMFFNGKVVNDVGNEDKRLLSDIIYFASAYEEEQ